MKHSLIVPTCSLEMPIPEPEPKPNNWTDTEPEPEPEPKPSNLTPTPLQGGWFQPTTELEPGNGYWSAPMSYHLMTGVYYIWWVIRWVIRYGLNRGLPLELGPIPFFFKESFWQIKVPFFWKFSWYMWLVTTKQALVTYEKNVIFLSSEQWHSHWGLRGARPPLPVVSKSSQKYKYVGVIDQTGKSSFDLFISALVF